MFFIIFQLIAVTPARNNAGVVAQFGSSDKRPGANAIEVARRMCQASADTWNRIALESGVDGAALTTCVQVAK